MSGEIKTERSRRTWFEKLKMWQRAYKTKVSAGSRSHWPRAYSGDIPRRRRKAMERRSGCQKRPLSISWNQASPRLFQPREPNSNLLRVPVRNAVLLVIGLFSLAMEKAPLRCGIASFSRRSESYSGGHHVFILECHFAHGGVYHQRGGVIPNRGRTRAEGLAYKKTSRRVRFAPSDP